MAPCSACANAYVSNPVLVQGLFLGAFYPQFHALAFVLKDRMDLQLVLNIVQSRASTQKVSKYSCHGRVDKAKNHARWAIISSGMTTVSHEL